MLGHTVERCGQHTPSLAAFDLAHLPGEFHFYALAQQRVVGIDDVSQEVDALGHGEHPLVSLDGMPDSFHTFVYGIADFSKLLFRGGENHTVIAVTVEVFHTEPVLQHMIEMDRQQQIAQPL